MIMRCITIDDEPLALAQMGKYIAKTPFLELVGSFRSAVEAASWLDENGADAIFVDINMPGMSGMDFVRSLKIKPLVIFSTAYSEYAVEGFRVDATDYLLKPIGYDDFLNAAEKAYRRFCLANGPQKGAEENGTIFIRSEYKVIPVKLGSITHIESRSEYVRIFTDGGGKPVMTLGSLKSYEQRLPEGIFMRVHRSYIINLSKIASVERRIINLACGACIPVGELYEEKFREFISRNSYKS